MNPAAAVGRHWSIFKIHLIAVVNFRLRALVWFLVGAMNTLIVLLFWWAALQANTPGEQVTELPALTSYYILLMALSSITICHIEDDISSLDVQKGDLYQYLLRPYSYILSKFHEEFVWRLLSGFWAVIMLIMLSVVGFNLIVTSDPRIWLLVIFSTFLGMLCSFFVKVCIGLLSIWLTNIRGFSDLYTIFEIILAGFIVPLALLPDALQKFALFSPFATYVYYPIRLLTTPLPAGEVLQILFLQLFWIAIGWKVSHWLLQKGIRHYTGVSQ